MNQNSRFKPYCWDGKVCKNIVSEIDSK